MGREFPPNTPPDIIWNDGFEEGRAEGISAALEVCRKLRDEEPLPESWGLIFTDGYKAGTEACCSTIINELHPKL